LQREIKKEAFQISTEDTGNENVVVNTVPVVSAVESNPPVSSKKMIVTKARTTTPTKSAVKIHGAKPEGTLTEINESLYQVTEFCLRQCHNIEFETLSSKHDEQSVSVNMNVLDNGYEYGGMIQFQNEQYMGQESDALSSNSFDEYMLNDNGWVESGPIDYYELLSSTNSHGVSEMESCDHCHVAPTKKFITESDQGRE
jgi:hypothetical protein